MQENRGIHLGIKVDMDSARISPMSRKDFKFLYVALV